jgi:uncharacterized protein YggE
VTVRDVSILGDLIAKAVEAGATTYSGLSYQMSDPSENYNAALKAALQDAERKAQAIAEEAGATLGAIPVSVNEGYSETPSVMREAAAADKTMSQGDAVSSVPVSSGSLEVKANITVVYEITVQAAQ